MHSFIQSANHWNNPSHHQYNKLKCIIQSPPFTPPIPSLPFPSLLSLPFPFFPFFSIPFPFPPFFYLTFPSIPFHPFPSPLLPSCLISSRFLQYPTFFESCFCPIYCFSRPSYLSLSPTFTSLPHSPSCHS